MRRKGVRRRGVLAAGGAALAGMGAGGPAAAPVVLGALLPLTGAGSAFGPGMRDMAVAAVKAANEAGGILGRPVRLVVENDGTDRDAGVRAARKMIDVDKVGAILGTWASAVTAAVAPLCWESGTFLATVSGADGITELPHQGYLIRTEPTAALQGREGAARLVRALGLRRPFFVGPMLPFSDALLRGLEAGLDGTPERVEVGRALYDPAKPGPHAEVEAALRGNADGVVAGGYGPDTAVLLRELRRVGFGGTVLGFGFGIGERLVAELPKELTEGVWSVSPMPEGGTTAFKAAAALVGRTEVDTYPAQVFDQVNLVLLAMQLAGTASGQAVRDTVREVSQGDGPKVGSLPDGLAALKDGAKALDYEGASGPCTFDSVGDVVDARFRFERVEGGRLVAREL